MPGITELANGRAGIQSQAHLTSGPLLSHPAPNLCLDHSPQDSPRPLSSYPLSCRHCLPRNCLPPAPSGGWQPHAPSSLSCSHCPKDGSVLPLPWIATGHSLGFYWQVTIYHIQILWDLLMEGKIAWPRNPEAGPMPEKIFHIATPREVTPL